MLSPDRDKGGAMRFFPDSNPDSVRVPEGTILALTADASYNERSAQLIKSLSGSVSRDWFTSYFYHCLPLVIGNQYGLVMILESDTCLHWNGGAEPDDLTVVQPSRQPDAIQNVHSLFGQGIVTVDNPWVFRTAPGTSLLVTSPPNYPVDGLSWMTAVVETDHLRTDFTINIKVTRRNFDIFLPAGTPISCCIPIPRHFGDTHEVRFHTEDEGLQQERKAFVAFQFLRHRIMRGKIGGLYRKGFDQYGSRFDDHQRR